MFEHLGAFQGLCGQSRQRRKEAQIRLARFGLRDERQREDSEGTNTSEEGLAHDGHGPGELQQDPGHDLGLHALAHIAIGGDRGDDGQTTREAGARIAAIERHHGAGEERRVAAAGQTGQTALASGRDAHHRGLCTQRPSATGDGRMGHIAGRRGRSQRRTELVQMLAALQVDELGEGEPGPLDGLGSSTGDGEEERPVGLGDLTFVVPVHHHGTDGVVGHDEGDDRERTEPIRVEGRVDIGAIALEVVDGLGEEGDVLTQDRAVGLQGTQHPVRRVVRRVAEAAERLQVAPFVQEGERRSVHAQFVSHGGEDGVGHLRRVGGRRERSRHGLHALCRLGCDAPTPLVPGFGACGPQLHIALTAEVRDPHRHCGCRQHRDHAQRVVQLAVTVGGRADDEGEERGQNADQRHPRGTGEGSGDEGGDSQESDQRDVPAVDGEDDRHRRSPDQGDEDRHGLGPINAGAPRGCRKLLVSWFGHVLSAGRRPGRPTLFSSPEGQVQPRRPPGLSWQFLPMRAWGETPVASRRFSFSLRRL